MSKNQLRSSEKHRRCDFANGAAELELIASPCHETSKSVYKNILPKHRGNVANPPAVQYN